MNKPRNNPLIHKLTVRLDEPMYARLNDIAGRSNQTLGNNLNQIAWKLNSGIPMDVLINVHDRLC